MSSNSTAYPEDIIEQIGQGEYTRLLIKGKLGTYFGFGLEMAPREVLFFAIGSLMDFADGVMKDAEKTEEFLSCLSTR